jgi:hypothetical protein
MNSISRINAKVKMQLFAVGKGEVLNCPKAEGKKAPYGLIRI